MFSHLEGLPGLKCNQHCKSTLEGILSSVPSCSDNPLGSGDDDYSILLEGSDDKEGEHFGWIFVFVALSPPFCVFVFYFHVVCSASLPC